MRADLDVELVDEVPFVGNIDGRRIEVGRRQRGDVVLLGELFEARHQDLRLDFFRDRGVVLLLDEFTRRVAGAETSNLRLIAHYWFGPIAIVTHLGCGLRLVLRQHGVSGERADLAPRLAIAAGVAVSSVILVALLGVRIG